MNPKPAGWKGGNEANSEWVGVTLGSSRAFNVNTDPEDLTQERFSRHPVDLNWQDEIS